LISIRQLDRQSSASVKHINLCITSVGMIQLRIVVKKMAADIGISPAGI